MSTRFAHAVREELWSRGRLVESRLSHGEAHDDGEGIFATDARDDAFVGAAERELARLRDAMPTGFIVRLVAEAGTGGVQGTMIVRDGARSIVTTPGHVEHDVALLRASVPRTSGGRTLVWQNGSAAVLLHELVGHPREHGVAELALPPWLEVDVALAMRRATFRDVPLLRMQHVRASQTDAPFALPEDGVEIALVEGGAYDPLTDIVTLHVAESSIGAFTIHEPRERFVFTGARGEPLRYPGVVCSREGQELVVASFAPVLLTELR